MTLAPLPFAPHSFIYCLLRAGELASSGLEVVLENAVLRHQAGDPAAHPVSRVPCMCRGAGAAAARLARSARRPWPCRARPRLGKPCGERQIAILAIGAFRGDPPASADSR